MNRMIGIALGGIAPAALLGATLVSAFDAGSQERGASFSPYVDAEGNIERPTGFRESWAHLGTYVVPDDEHARGPGVHDVYAPKETVEAFKETGEFPDGAVLVKEIRGIESAEMTTGHASWAGEPKVWFVMVKDRQNRFPDSPIWGEGWGWALYTADQPSVNVNEDWQEGDLSNCYGCHIPAEQTDWVFLEGYPTLR